MIASHYAEPLERRIARETPLRGEPSETSETLAELRPGEPFWMLDSGTGWAWGYAGAERRVGYVPSQAVGTA